MDFNMLFLANPDEKSTKSLILRALAAHIELTNAKLQRIIRKEFGKKITYQAIRQALVEMLEEQILEKKDNHYSINSSWVSKIKEFANTLEKAVVRKQDIKIIDKETTQVKLNSLNSLGFFILYGLENKYFDFSKKGNLMVQLRHLLIPFNDIRNRERIKGMFEKNNTEIVIGNKSLLDRILYRWFNKACKKVSLGKSIEAEYLVHGDCVVQIYLDEKLKKKMDEIYNIKNLLKFNIVQKLTEMTYGEHEINLVITRNSKIAEQISNTIKLNL